MNQLSTCGDIFQVTPPQRQLFQLNRAGDVFCLSVAVDGPLDPDRLQQALVDLADGREILRTRYSRLPGQKTPVQQVMHEGIGSTEMVNLGSVEETDPAKIADAFTAQLPAFDLAEGPLLRVAVAAPSEGPTLLLMVFPAIVAGADGAAALLEALVSAYAQVGKTVEEEEIVQYGAFAEWQLDLLEDEETADEARAYWDRQLRVSPLIPKHHTAATVVEQGTYAMGTRLSQRVFDYCDEVECTPSAFWLSCWQIWLRSRHGAGPFRLAARVSRREGEGLESVLGPLFKDVPLAVNPTTEQSFSQLSEQTGDQLNGADDYAEFFEPTTNVNGDAEPPAALLWSYESALVPITGAGLNWNPLTLKRPSSPYRLESAMSHGKEGFSLFVQSKGGLRVASHATGLAAVAEAVLSEPERAINQLDLLTRDEKEFLQTFNQTEREPGGNPFLHRRFEVAAARHPSRVAVGDGRKNYTYAELNQRANRVADRMIQAGVVADNLVALEGHGHPDFVVGLLAILKAGGAYVPLDPDLPVARLEKMHDNLGRPPVLYLRRPLPGIEPDSQWDLDALAADSALDDANPSPQLEPCNLAYALFTSGSTGEPKAVLLEHAQLANYLDGVIAALDLQENASYGMISSPAADLGNTMLFPSLALGGNLRIFDYQVRIDPEALSELLEREPLDYLKIVPSHLTALLESESSTLLPRRSLILGGEAATSGLLAAIARLTPDCTVYNHYGPTETCVGVLVHKMGRAAAGVAAVGERGLPLGRPLANTRIYLRDAKGEEVPPGVTGEICIAGASLARGYLGRPDLSSERFGVDPTGARFYRTGDLAFFHEGDLYFVGRLDHQVKIRGFRVELGEIETVLRRVSAASEAAVMVDSEAPETGLIGYLAGLPENLDESRLRADLERELPAHMIPTRFMCLDRLPLNANGKLDRKALPKPQDQGDKREYAAPTNERERHLCGIWQRALGLEKVGVTDNFFHLGGDSVIAIKIMAHAKKAGILLTPKL
nr:amino acid adenylation domain-containing protein [Acidobacteriota bacterium]